MKIALFLPALLLVVGSVARAEKTGIKVNDIDSSQDTSILIKKGDVATCNEYTIVEGQEEVFGSPEYDKAKARASWKTACNEWKAGIRELNRDNSVLVLSCAQPTPGKEGDQWLYSGQASYKIKTKTKERVR